MKMLPRILIATTLLMFISFSYSQGQNLKHELGIRMSGLNDFDFIYKKQKKENTYTRYRFLLTNINYNNTIGDGIINIATGFAIGREKRKQIVDKLHFIHGFEPSLLLSYDQRGEEFKFTLAPALGYVLGFQYDIASNFYINLETIPGLGSNFIFDNDGLNDVFSIYAGFNTRSTAISLVYRFGKK